MDVDIDKVKDRLREAFILLYNNDLNAKQDLKQVTVEGLLGITLNNEQIVLVNINENLSSDTTETRLNIGRPLPKGATKRPFPHKNVRPKPFKRYRTADPSAKPSSHSATNHTGEEGSTVHENKSMHEENTGEGAISEKDGDRADADTETPIVSLSDHISETDGSTTKVKSEPAVIEETRTETDIPDEEMEDEASCSKEVANKGDEEGIEHKDRDASVNPETRIDMKEEVKEETDEAKQVKVETEISDLQDEKKSLPAKDEEIKSQTTTSAASDAASVPPMGQPDTTKHESSNTSNHGEVIPNHTAMVTNSATSAHTQSYAQTVTGNTSVTRPPIGGHQNPTSTAPTNPTGHNFTEKAGVPGEMVNSTNNVNWFPMPDTANCGMPPEGFGGENMMTDGTGMNNPDNMVTDTAQLFAATYQVLDGEEDGILSPNQHGFYDSKAQHAGHAAVSGSQMSHTGYQNAVTNSPNQSAPHGMAAATCSTGTGNIPTPNSMPGNNHGVHQTHTPHPQHSAHNIQVKGPEPPKLAHRNPQNPHGPRPNQSPYPGMWSHNQARVPGPPHNRPQGVGNMPPYGSPGPPPRSFPPNYPVRGEGTQPKSFENQFSDFIRSRHPYSPRGPNMQDPSRPQQMQSPNSAQNFQSPNVTMNKYQNVNRYPFHQSLGPAAGAIRDLACRVPSPQYPPRGPPMMQGNVGHQPLQHQSPSNQQPYNQGQLPPQAQQQQQPHQQQQQQGYMGPPHHHPQWNQPHGNIPMNQHQMMSQRQTPPHSQAQNFHPQQQAQQQLMQGVVRNDGSPVPQIASPSLSQQAISNIPPIDPPPIQHRSTPDKLNTPKKKKSSPKISRESSQETVKMQEEKALLENPHANVHIGHPKGKKCKFHRTKNSKDKYTVFGCRACNVALCKECHDQYHNELNESQQQK